MQVTIAYAEAHLAELLSAAQGGQEIEISRPGMSSLRLAVAEVNGEKATPRARGFYGIGKGEIWLAEDWDSKETNAEIAALFNDGPIFPDEPPE